MDRGEAPHGSAAGEPHDDGDRRRALARSRNPLYLGLLAGSAGLALLAGSLWALVLLPVEWALLQWGAVLPEERYLAGKFGSAYDDYRRRVRRWL